MVMVVALAHFALLEFDKPRDVETRLRTLLQARKAVKFRYDEDTLVVKLRTRLVKTAPQTKGPADPNAKKILVEQPKFNGFKLEVYEFSHGQNEPARPEQMVRPSPNWLWDYGTYKLDAEERQVDGKDLARYYYIEWGNDFDPKLLAKIRRALDQGTHPFDH
jgi:hypothetical protein